jgi:Glycosyl transferase family 2
MAPRLADCWIAAQMAAPECLSILSSARQVNDDCLTVDRLRNDRRLVHPERAVSHKAHGSDPPAFDPAMRMCRSYIIVRRPSPAFQSMISVVIAVHNGAKFLAATLNSVMRQTCAPGEVIVVDDGSTDASPDIAAGFELPIRRCAHREEASALNAGLAEARGELLAFIDADDLWDDQKPARQSLCLRFIHRGCLRPC